MNPMNRRLLLRRGLAGVAALGLDRRLGSAAGTASRPTIPEPCPPSRWQKHGLALEPTEPWEGTHIQNFTSPVEPLDAGRWRLWYTAGATLCVAEGRPGEPMTRSPAARTSGTPGDGAFVIGNLPDNWTPGQVVHIRLPCGRHRIYFWVHGPEVLRYLAAESDDGRRYTVLNPHKPVLHQFYDRAAAGVASPDGLMLRKKPADRPADERAADPRQICNDATTVYQLPDGTFELYSATFVQLPAGDPGRAATENGSGLVRVVDRFRSDDGLFFPERRRAIDRDVADPVDQQFYSLSVTRTPKGCVGMLGHYRVRAQTMDLEWCFSPDGAAWQRPHRGAWLPRGPDTEVDCYGIYAPAGLVHRDGRWHLFYTATNEGHDGKDARGRPRMAVMYATADSIWS
jgi:hypothetical protein